MVTIPQPASAISFPGQESGEVFQFYFHQHWMRLRRTAQILIVGVALYAAALWLLVSMPEDGTRQMLLVSVTTAFLFLHFFLLARFYTYFLYVIVVTDQKVHRIKKTLIAMNDRQSIDFWSLSDITKQQHGIVQNLFGFGTVVLHGNEQLKIHFTPHIREQVERLAMLRAQARGKMIRPAGQPA